MKLNILLNVLSVFLSILLTACVYDFKPDKIEGYENNLVVYGCITNQDEIIQVYLSRTSDLYSAEFIPETNAFVTIKDDNGNVVQLFEQEAGKYFSLEPFKGVAGTGYMLEILTNESIYKSEFVTLTEPVDIKEVSSDVVEISTTDIDRPTTACQFSISVDGAEAQQNYFRYEFVETWMVSMPYVPLFYWNGYEYIEPSLAKRCWMEKKINSFEILNLEGYGGSTVENFPIKHVLSENGRFFIKYSLNVMQFSLSEEAYLYWKIQSDNLDLNNLFAKNPYQVMGNIKNVNNPDEKVIGIFEASGVSSKRIFVDNTVITGSPAYSYCAPGNQPDRDDWILGFYGIKPQPMGPVFTVPDICVDCTLTGGNPEQPDYWE